jgi:hypothetical protein
MARRQRKTYLMRWNPNISTYTREDFEQDMKSFVKKGSAPNDMNWTVYEDKDVKPGDLFFLAQVGCEMNGIVWGGIIDDEPYEMQMDDGTRLPRRFVDTVVQFMQRIEKKRILTKDTLCKSVPEIDWEKGHSGVLLSAETSERLALAVGNELLHAKGDADLVFDSFDEQRGVICDMVGYLCPTLKRRLIEENRVNEEVRKDLKKKKKIAITDLSVEYSEKDVRPDARLEDILYVTYVGIELITKGEPKDPIDLSSGNLIVT